MQLDLEPGSIPACAGEPAAPQKPPEKDSVYPRVCGGTNDSLFRLLRGGGLSPRVRGNHTLSSMNRPSSRSIPACAGEPNTK